MNTIDIEQKTPEPVAVGQFRGKKCFLQNIGREKGTGRQVLCLSESKKIIDQSGALPGSVDYADAYFRQCPAGTWNFF